jgi:segregation and condensation protein A
VSATTNGSANPRFRIEIFEGPLDLLLHLIKKNEVDVYDIPIATITDQYLEVLQFLDQLNLDLAGEYLVMAATLMQIKSRMLLPPAEGEEDEDEDPRAELVQQLEEYRRFREAAEHLADRDILHRDVFPRAPEPVERAAGELPPLRELSMGDLLEALREVLKRLPQETAHSIVAERISIADRIPTILERLRAGDVEFTKLFPADATRREIITTFLALLELVRLRAVRAMQTEVYGPIVLTLAVKEGEEVQIVLDDSYKD